MWQRKEDLKYLSFISVGESSFTAHLHNWFPEVCLHLFMPADQCNPSFLYNSFVKNLKSNIAHEMSLLESLCTHFSWIIFPLSLFIPRSCWCLLPWIIYCYIVLFTWVLQLSSQRAKSKWLNGLRLFQCSFGFFIGFANSTSYFLWLSAPGVHGQKHSPHHFLTVYTTTISLTKNHLQLLESMSHRPQRPNTW